MSKIFHKILKTDQFILIPLIFSTLSFFAISLSFIFFYKQLPSSLPLLYSLPWGQDQLVTKHQFFLLPGIILIITLVNWVLAFYLHQIHLILKRLIMVNLILVDILLLITFYKILSIFI